MEKKTRLVLMMMALLPMGVMAEEAPVLTDASAPVPAPVVRTIAEQDFDAVIDATIPLEPDEIRRLHKILDEQKRAAAEPVRTTIPRSRQLIVDVAPGSEMPMISVNKGMVSTLVFLDRHGEAWPVTSYKNGNASDYAVEPVTINDGGTEKDGTSNALTISTNSYSSGNLAVFLQGMTTPVVVGIESGGTHTDYRVDLRLNKAGPIGEQYRTEGFSKDKALPTYDTLLLSILGGVPPKGYKFKVLDNYLGDVFYSEERMFIRTGHKMISPLSKNMIKSADGTIVYEVETTSVVLMLVDGSVKRVRVQ